MINYFLQIKVFYQLKIKLYKIIQIIQKYLKYIKEQYKIHYYKNYMNLIIMFLSINILYNKICKI